MTDETQSLSFEEAYGELKTILARLGEDDVPMAEVVKLTSRGKALEVAMTGYLDGARGELERIEKGEGLPEITIRRDLPEHDSAAPGTESSSPPAADDDIPF